MDYNEIPSAPVQPTRIRVKEPLPWYLYSAADLVIILKPYKDVPVHFLIQGSPIHRIQRQHSPVKPRQWIHTHKKLSNLSPCGSTNPIAAKIIQWSLESVIWTAQLPPNNMECLVGPFSQYL